MTDAITQAPIDDGETAEAFDQESNSSANGHANRSARNLTKPERQRVIACWLRLFVQPDSITELRALNVPQSYGRPCTVSGYFDYEHLDQAAEEALRLSDQAKAKGVYFVPNPVHHDLLARRMNRVERATDGETTADKHILQRRWLYIDADPIRDAKISASDEEKTFAWETVQAVRDFLRGRCWPDPILADSANGYHLLYQIDLPCDDGGLVEKVLRVLAQRFGTDRVAIDQTVKNPARIMKLYGSVARKGDDVPDLQRVHRRAKILEVPGCVDPLDLSTSSVQTVPRELLEALAAEATVETTSTPPLGPPTNGAGYDSRLLVEKWLDARGVAYRVKPDLDARGRRVFVLKECPFDSTHGDPDSCIMQDSSGKMSAQCFHNTCSGQGWQKFKTAIGKPDADHYDPPFQTRRSRPKPGTTGETNAESDEAEGSTPKPDIIIGVDQKRVNDAAVAALTAHPDIHQRGNMLVHVLRDDTKTRNIFRPPGSPRIAPLPGPVLAEMMASTANWWQEKKKRNGETDITAAHPPERSIANVAARGSWSGIRYLEAVVEAPTLRHDGTILEAPGWDAETGLLYEPRVAFPPVPANPTKADAFDAAERLLDLVAEFPFVDDTHMVAWLAALLTPFARFAFAGPSPCFLISANTPGTGKTLLPWIIAEIFEGREIARTPYSVKDEEMGKTITAVALNGDKIMLLDNIATGTPFGCASLDAALTGTRWKQRILGVSEMTPDLPLFTVWYATGNNVTMQGDSPRRVLPIRLETNEERPEERQGFKYPSLIQHVHENRPALVVDALTILRAYVVAGRPAVHLTPLGSYEGWSDCVRNSLFWATGRDPVATRGSIGDTDDAKTTLTAILEGWSQLPDGTGDGATVAEAIRNVQEFPDKYRALHDALMGWAKDDKLPGPRIVGNRLRSLRGRVQGGRALKGEQDRNGYIRWKVVSAPGH